MADNNTNVYIEENTMLTTKEVLQILRISRSKLGKLTKSGELKGAKLGRDWRFTKADIEAYINKNTQK